MLLDDQSEQLLKGAITKGRAVLFLGAGASATSLNRKGQPVKTGGALADTLANSAGMPYNKEKLSEVVEAVVGPYISRVQFEEILRNEYTGIKPSLELAKIFRYCWKRVYTWNVDDAINCAPAGVQVRRAYNGMKDKVAEYNGIEYLQVISLHGEALKPEHGFIFSMAEYLSCLSAGRHDWYRQAAHDYIAETPIFIGSRLEEPILSAELDRARPEIGEGLGMAFLVTPDSFTPLQLAVFKKRGISVIGGTLSDFISWLESNIGQYLKPADVSDVESALVKSLGSRIIPVRTEVDTARDIRIHTISSLKALVAGQESLLKNQMARAYLEGYPPTWPVVVASIPVVLSATRELSRFIGQAFENRDRMVIVYGQSGSGKTTAIMQCILEFLEYNEGYPVYEIVPSAKSLRSCLELLCKLHKNEHFVVYIGDAFLYGDLLDSDVLSFPAGSFTILSSARSGEWRQHIRRRVGDFASAFELQRFIPNDYPGLIARLLEFVPAPSFRRMSPSDRLRKLASSKEQLLIAMKEATSSEKFAEVITREYGSLPDDDSRSLFVVVGLATIARTGISRAMAVDAYRSLRKSRSFESAVDSLEGMIGVDPQGRYIARHEVYVRHILDNVAGMSLIVNCIISVLGTYTRFETPIVKNVSRLESALFKFVLNHNFIWDIAHRRNNTVEGMRIYQAFEVSFQLDGHFWLQYGQYLVNCGDLEGALAKVKNSIDAYPDNSYAVHSLADLRIRVAARRDSYDAKTIELLGDAVKALEELHAANILEVDYYPIVTLSEGYVGALVKHHQKEAALAAAKRYFDIISRMPQADDQIVKARKRLMLFVTQGTWDPHGAGVAASNKTGSRRKHRRR
jgi:tetratricopeptide (TPR) repeat protein